MQIFIVLACAVLLTAFTGNGDPFERAVSAAAEGRYETAAHHYSVVLASGALSNGSRATAHNNRGVAFAKLGRYQQALREFTAAKSMAAGDSILFSNMETARRIVLARSQGTEAPDPIFAQREKQGGFWFF